MKIAPFPELRQYAEEEARLRYDTFSSLAGWADDRSFAALDDDQRHLLVLSEVTILTDLSRRASRDAVCRLVAIKIGWLPCHVMTAIHLGGIEYDALLTVAGATPQIRPHTPATRLAAIVAALWGGA